MKLYVVAYEVGGVLDGFDVFASKEELEVRRREFEKEWEDDEEGYANLDYVAIDVSGDNLSYRVEE
jgi:hypothetical protein